MQSSLFCLVPEGDSPESRRLFDALATGCVPIVMRRKAVMDIDLPFSGTTHHDPVPRSIRPIQHSPHAHLLDSTTLTFTPHTFDTGTSIQWRQVALFVEWPAQTADGILSTARWLETAASNASLIEGLRSQGRTAFSHFLDLNYNTTGTVGAVLTDLATRQWLS